MTALQAAIHLSISANKNNPMHVPTIAPGVLGTQPRNHILSPAVKWRYGSICPSERDIAPSMDMSMPLLSASTVVVIARHRMSRVSIEGKGVKSEESNQIETSIQPSIVGTLYRSYKFGFKAKTNGKISGEKQGARTDKAEELRGQ